MLTAHVLGCPTLFWLASEFRSDILKFDWIGAIIFFLVQPVLLGVQIAINRLDIGRISPLLNFE